MSDIFPYRCDDTSKLMTRNVRDANIRIMPHPTVPVTEAESSRFDADDNTAIRRSRVWDNVD